MSKQILIGEPRELVYGDLITTLKKIEKEYIVSFDFNYTGRTSAGSVIHFNDSSSVVGGRIPAVYKNESRFEIHSAVNGKRHTSTVNVNEGTWHKIEIGQEKTGEIYHYFIRVDGKEVQRVENSIPQAFENVKVYACDPWCGAAPPGNIRNFYIVNGREIDPKLKCTVCKDIFKEPKILYCMHTFCSQCIQTLCGDTFSVVTCPLCTHKTQIGRNQELLWKNHLIQEEVLKHFGKYKVLRCNVCENEACVKYCCDCKIRLCELCTQHHMRCACNVGHKVVNVSDLPEDSLLECEVTTCVTHKKHANYYCDQCESLSCIDCVHSKLHKGHSFTLADELLEEEWEPIKKLISDCKLKSQEYEAVYLKGVEQFMVGAEERNKTSVKTVKDTYHMLRSLLQAGEERQLKLLDESYLSSKSSLGNAREGLNILEATIEYLERVMLFPKGSMTEALFEGSKRLKENLQHISDVCEKKTPELDNVFKVKAEAREIVDVKSNLDHIKIMLEEIQFTEHNQCYDDTGNF